MRRSDRREAPPDWGCDSLTRYFDAVRANQFASYHNKRIVAQDLIRVDGLLADALCDWQDPAAMMPAMLFYRSHAAFRAGAGAALAGQTAEAPCLLRLCLECAGYAAVIGKKHQTAETFRDAVMASRRRSGCVPPSMAKASRLPCVRSMCRSGPHLIVCMRASSTSERTRMNR